MYLNQLDAKEKELFLDLSIHLALSDESISQKEIDAICLLCDEMQIEKRFSADLSVDDAISEAKKCKNVSRNIIFVELLGIAMADDVFDKREKDLMKRISDELEIHPNDAQRISKDIVNLFKIYQSMSKFIYGA